MNKQRIRCAGNSANDFIGEEGKGFRYILDGMNAERILVAQECIGDGRRLLNKGVEYTKERVVFDRPIGQGVQFPLARTSAESLGELADELITVTNVGQSMAGNRMTASLQVSRCRRVMRTAGMGHEDGSRRLG